MKANNVSGVYKIENEDGLVYIGVALDIAERWHVHMSKLRHNKHPYNQLQKSWDEDCNNLKWEIMERCPEEEFSDREKFWVKHCNRIDGWTVINIEQDDFTRKKRPADTSKMKLAQTGAKNGNAKYTEDQIRAIKIKLSQGVSVADISEETGISVSYLNLIKYGYKWAKVVV
jgi:hypothetical protein